VSDTGIGMTQETLSRIFEPFFTTKEAGKGTGLGLAVVFGVIKEHNGWINVESKPGAGTTFTIHLPLLERDDAVDASVSKQSAPATARGGRVLVVEDEESIRNLMAAALRSDNHTVFEADSVRTAQRTLDEQRWDVDLIVCDAILPDRKGIDFLCEVVEKVPRQKVILASGYTDERSGYSVAVEKGWPLLQKPFALSELQRVVAETLKRQDEPGTPNDGRGGTGSSVVPLNGTSLAS